MASLRRIPLVVLIGAMLLGLAAPAFCAPAQSRMPCCEPGRECGAALSRIACCGSGAPMPPASERVGAPQDRFDAMVAPLAIAPVVEPGTAGIPQAGEPLSLRPESPPLYLRHSAILR